MNKISIIPGTRVIKYLKCVFKHMEKLRRFYAWNNSLKNVRVKLDVAGVPGHSPAQRSPLLLVLLHQPEQDHLSYLI